MGGVETADRRHPAPGRLVEPPPVAGVEAGAQPARHDEPRCTGSFCVLEEPPSQPIQNMGSTTRRPVTRRMPMRLRAWATSIAFSIWKFTSPAPRTRRSPSRTPRAGSVRATARRCRSGSRVPGAPGPERGGDLDHGGGVDRRRPVLLVQHLAVHRLHVPDELDHRGCRARGPALARLRIGREGQQRRARPWRRDRRECVGGWRGSCDSIVAAARRSARSSARKYRFRGAPGPGQGSGRMGTAGWSGGSGGEPGRARPPGRGRKGAVHAAGFTPGAGGGRPRARRTRPPRARPRRRARARPSGAAPASRGSGWPPRAAPAGRRR